MEEKFSIWLILDLFVRVITMLAVVVILAKSLSGIILTILIILLILWAFRPVWLAWRNLKLLEKRTNSKGGGKEPNWNKKNFYVSLVSLMVLIILSLGIAWYQSPKPDVSNQLYVNDQNGTLDIYFYNTGERAVILSNLTLLEVEGSLVDLNRGLPIMISPFSDVQLISTNEKIKENIEYIINYCYVWGEKNKCVSIGPKSLKNVYRSNVDLSIKISQSVSISIIRHRNRSIITFYTKPLNDYNTTCYIENIGGNPEKYVIDELNFSTDYIPAYETFEFNCKIKNNEVFGII